MRESEISGLSKNESDEEGCEVIVYQEHRKKKQTLWMWTDPEDLRHYGSCTPFFYYKGEPLCVLGPDCNLYINVRVFLSANDIICLRILGVWRRNVDNLSISNSLCNNGSFSQRNSLWINVYYGLQKPRYRFPGSYGTISNR